MIFNPGFIVTLYSPQILKFPFGFNAGTIGVAHSLCVTGSMISSETNLARSASILFLTKKEPVLVLKIQFKTWFHL